MKTYIIQAIVVALFLSVLNGCDPFEGPTPKKFFAKTTGYGGDDFAQSLIQSKDGNFIIAGYTNSIRNNFDFFLVKTDQRFNTIWSKTTGGEFLDRCYDICPTPDNGAVIVGTVFLSGSNSDAFVIKVDWTGRLLWSKNFGNDDKDDGRAVTGSSQGDLTVAYTLAISPTNTDIALVHMDANGNIQWTKTYGDAVNKEAVRSICETPDGGYLIAGYRSLAPEWDMLLIRLSASGEVIWEMIYNNRYQDEPLAMRPTSDGGFIIVSRTYTPDPGGDTGIWILKVNGNGDVQFSKTLGDTYVDIGYAVAEAADGFIITGSTFKYPLGDQFYIAKIDALGNTQWEKIYGDTGSDVGNGCLVQPDSSIVVSGYTQKTGNTDFLLMRLDTEGNLE